MRRHLTAPAPVRDAKRRISTAVSRRLLNPFVRWAIERGVLTPAWALLETTGRRTGRPVRTPVGNGLRGPHFWIVTEHGYAAAYVKNLQHEPRVRVKVGRHWLGGTARILPDDDPYARLRWLRRPVNDAALLAMGTEQLVVRVDLDDPPAEPPRGRLGGLLSLS
jgi:deazaflavin-dependent oxidoreductase (nitroreductase family)